MSNSQNLVKLTEKPIRQCQLGPSQIVVSPDDELKVFKQSLKKALRWGGLEPDTLIKSYQNALCVLIDEKDETKRNELAKKISGEHNTKLLQALSLDTMHFMVSAVDESDHVFAVEVFNELSEEFDVKQPSEKALLQMATLSFVQFLKYSNLLNTNSAGFVNESYLGILSKEADRCYRRYISAIQLLQQVKTPSMKINIKTENAYMAQNQLINNPNPVNNETNKQ